MSCVSGHEYTSFKKSRDLFCVSCGDLRIFNQTSSYPYKSEHVSNSNNMIHPNFIEPIKRYTDHTTNDDLISDIDIFQNKVADIINEYELPGHIKKDLFNMAIEFGPGLDLIHFEENKIKPLLSVIPKEKHFDEDLDQFDNH